MLAIRLMRMGAKKRPSYRVVVKEKHSKRDGAYLENLGTYDPTHNPAQVRLNLERVSYWLSNGAQPTNTVEQLIKTSRLRETSLTVEPPSRPLSETLKIEL